MGLERRTTAPASLQTHTSHSTATRSPYATPSTTTTWATQQSQLGRYNRLLHPDQQQWHYNRTSTPPPQPGPPALSHTHLAGRLPTLASSPSGPHIHGRKKRSSCEYRKLSSTVSVEESERRVVLALGSVNSAPAPSFFPSLSVSARASFSMDSKWPTFSGYFPLVLSDGSQQMTLESAESRCSKILQC